ncbi:MAG: hypothetical protein EOP51_13670, partial [Sphingobacteriales bacterium]
MKKQLLIALLTLGLAAPVFAQQDTTRDAKEMKKDRKAEKKAEGRCGVLHEASGKGLIRGSRNTR